VLIVGFVLASTLVSEDVTEPFPGVTVRERRYDDPDNDVWVAEVDLCAEGVEVLATEQPSSRRTTGSWAESVGAQLAVNGDFYASTSVYGDAVGGGVRWSSSQTGVDDTSGWYYLSYGFIALGEGWADFTHSSWTKANRSPTTGLAPTEPGPDPHADTLSLVSGFPQLVFDGVTYDCSSPTASDCFPDRSDMRARHPRNAMGLTEDRRTLIFAVVDGRSSRSSGMYGAELAELMGDLGAWQAFNLDGGGSATFWAEGQGAMNEPSDGSMRSVVNHWGVVADGEGAPKHCFEEGGCYPVATDDGGHWADLADDAEVLAVQDLVDDCEPGFFCPNCGITRAELITWIGRALEWPTEGPATPTFSDVPADHPAYAYVEEAAARGITNGCGDDKFCPDAVSRRAHGAAFLARSWALEDPGTATFSDVIETWRPDVEALVEACVVEACEGDRFCPDEDLDRADAARWIHRLVEPPCPDLPGDTSPIEDTGPAALDGAPGPREPLGGGCGGLFAGLLLIWGLLLRRR